MYRWRRDMMPFFCFPLPFHLLVGITNTRSVKVVDCTTMIPGAERFRNCQDACKRYRVELIRPPSSKNSNRISNVLQ
ncbi:hypothetical protein BKA58DRAFT_176701 [Alternaria rosae]|uniref:uncharacterized protein n=1 Tax=Alternaria rosae TaxID=1187941 RepID=UPI001E8CAFAF|nr:uncharacterized protein BKA58DRAFT_176701 [Alternaria rosae]KAH6870430.1 hypothetical protein BKA58DRAFT_176701 [Alternaria rosae]